MPIELPNLDDKTYAELVEEARAALPGHAPDWTDHNPSDPGIALVEMLAWLTEMLIYRTGRLPEESVRTFLRLLDGAPTPVAQRAGLGDATRSTMRSLRERWRAVTPEDYESLALYRWPDSPEATRAALPDSERHLARVCCLAERDVTGADPTAVQPGHVSLVVVPGASEASPWAPPRQELLTALTAFFRERRVVSTRFHAAGPRYVALDITATLYLRDDARARDVRKVALQALTGYFDPRVGGRDQSGWPFGREVPASEIYATLDGAPGVEFVKDVILDAPSVPDTRKVLSDERVIAVQLNPDELPRLEATSIHLTLMERRGDTWQMVP